MLVELDNLSKAFAATQALNDFSFQIAPGEVVGLLGANGAGKSTLIKVISGLLTPDQGELAINGAKVDIRNYTRARAQGYGIRTVFQELSLCLHQTAIENFYIEQPALAKGLFFRRKMRKIVEAAIQDVFPGAALPLDVPVGRMSIAERQMIEISRAAISPVQLLILDEPTSSLDANRTTQLLDFVRRRSAEGTSFILVTHKLKEAMSVASRILVMRNGKSVVEGDRQSLSLETVIWAMGGALESAKDTAETSRRPPGQIMITIDEADVWNGLDRTINLRAGEIVGIAGLEGNGQKALLRRVYFKKRRTAGTEFPSQEEMTFVSGDRPGEGIFPLLSILHNSTIRRIAMMPWFSWLSRRFDSEEASELLVQLGIPIERHGQQIGQFSGGNQQKAIMIRPIVAGSSCVLLDDPTRGVDIATKQQIYRLIKNGAHDGRLFLWTSSEDLEYAECDRVLVMRKGRIVDEIDKPKGADERLLSASFRDAPGTNIQRADKSSHSKSRISDVLSFLPWIVLAVVFGLTAMRNSSVMSSLGVDLLLTAAVPLLFVGLAQMFIVSGSQIDLGVGAFAALANVVAATYLHDSIFVGLGIIALMMAAYCAAGAIVVLRKIPSIVVTLGTSFIWLGTAHTLLPNPGGEAPEWLQTVFNFQISGVPPSVAIVVLAVLIAGAIVRSPLGVVLRGFGDNEIAMVQAGWSSLKVQLIRYVIAGAFAVCCGLAMTAYSGAADSNSGSSLTLLSVASIVMGGCSLMGGNVSALGAGAGAIVVSLLGTMLSSYDVSTNYSALVQGGILLAILFLQSIRWRLVK